MYDNSLNYHHHAGYEIALITTAPQPVIEITQTHNRGYDGSCLTSSFLENPKCSSDTYAWGLLFIGLPSYSTEVLYILGWLNTSE